MHFEYNNDHQKYKMNGQELMVTEEEVDTGVKVTKNLKPRLSKQYWDSYAEPSPTSPIPSDLKVYVLGLRVHLYNAEGPKRV
jgi:hypothetical protein